MDLKAYISGIKDAFFNKKSGYNNVYPYRNIRLTDHDPLEAIYDALGYSPTPIINNIKSSHTSQLKAYTMCAPLSSIIDKIASADVSGKIRVVRERDENDSNSPFSKRLLSLIDSPNPWQTWGQFRREQVVFKNIFGFCPVFVPNSGTNDPSFSKFMYNLPAFMATPFMIGSPLFKENMSDIIEYWDACICGYSYKISPVDIFTLDQGISTNDNRILPCSRLSSLETHINAILAAVEAEYVLTAKKGPVGAISPKIGNDIGHIVLNEQEKKDLHESLSSSYGTSRSKRQLMISPFPIEWTPMSYNLADLLTNKTIKGATEAICDKFNYPFELLSNENGATFSNKKEAKKSLYQDTIIPSNRADIEEYNRFFGCKENGVKIFVDYSELPILQEDEMTLQAANKIKTETLIMQYNNGIITKNKMLELLGYEPLGAEGDLYKELNITV